jgi:hypothetical protein
LAAATDQYAGIGAARSAVQFPDFPILSKFSAKFCAGRSLNAGLSVENWALNCTLDFELYPAYILRIKVRCVQSHLAFQNQSSNMDFTKT